ncbi:uncharacterized protein isoform X1 [Takifugu rubripes]|uniref:uncharacterized protein isoform X1 n=1 Tax=Takifugu rubripes TaxID=31033 RepID=UPI001145DA5F|nr:uncharacterized protein LOC115251006 isoform X1 [Takifugu rubripes]
MTWKRGMSITGYLPSGDYLTQTVNRQVILVMLLLCYHLWFQIDFICPCGSNQNYFHCYSYMVLPSIIITCIILWNDKRIGRFLRYNCNYISLERKRSTRKFNLQFLVCVLQAATSGFFWCGSVLVDGDWYLCCGLFDSRGARTSGCVGTEMSQTEKNDRIHLKNQSMVLGLICILLTAVCSFVLVLPWARWCLRRNHFRTLFEEAILEQTEKTLENEIQKAAANVVATSLATTTAVTSSKAAPEGLEKPTAREEILLNMNTNWEEIIFLADYLLESIPDNVRFKESIVKK